MIRFIFAVLIVFSTQVQAETMRLAATTSFNNSGLSDVLLQDVLDFPAPRLSGGEQQKLALGRALIRTPQVLFLDEPCANLDGRSTREIEELLKNATQAGTHIIMTTHDLGQARRLAGRILFFLNGTLHEQGNASEFFITPSTSAARAFLNGDIIE